MILKHSTQIVSDSLASLNNFRKIGNHDQGKECVIYPGIDLAPFARTIDRKDVRRRLSLPLDRPLICYVARFAPIRIMIKSCGSRICWHGKGVAFTSHWRAHMAIGWMLSSKPPTAGLMSPSSSGSTMCQDF